MKGYYSGAAGIVTEDNVLYHKGTVVSAGSDVQPVGINPGGKQIHIYKIVITITNTLPYYVQDSAGEVIFAISTLLSGNVFYDLGRTPIPVPTNNSDLYIYNITAVAGTFRIHVWYSLR